MYSLYLSDPDIQTLTDDEALIRQMLRVEVALAKVQAFLGIIPPASAEEIAERLVSIRVDPALLSAGILQNGIPTIPLLKIAKKHLSAAAREHLHWGVTSQDILDTATVLVIKEVSAVFEDRLGAIDQNLRKLAEVHRQTPTVARTRTQQAVPITFAHKVEQWYRPLQRHLERLEQLKHRLLVVQLGGAGGDLAALGDRGGAVARDLAQELDLAYDGSWHTQRDNLAEWASWLALVCGSLGKMAGDILLLSQTEIGEVTERSAGGGSSAMPHKNNPVLSEAVVALARYCSQLAGNHFQAMLHLQERDGAAWIQEWMSLPRMMVATGTALRHIQTISEEMSIDTRAMLVNLNKLNGLIYSERATYVLAKFMNRQEAKGLVGSACRMVKKEGIHLSAALRRLAPDLEVDWEQELRIRY